MAFAQRILLAIALLMLGACRSEPIQFHTLTPTQPGSAPTRDIEVEIEGINVPPQVDRQQIVVRQSNSSLAILETHWWGATLADELSSALAQQLPTSSAARKVLLRLEVQRFESLPGQYALLDTKWRLRSQSPGNGAALHCRSTLRSAAGVNIDDIVIAHQNNLKNLALEISQAAGNAGGRCPPKHL